MIQLILSKAHIIRDFKEDIVIPAGTKGDLLDIIIEDGATRFLLTFEEFDEMTYVGIDSGDIRKIYFTKG